MQFKVRERMSHKCVIVTVLLLLCLINSVTVTTTNSVTTATFVSTLVTINKSAPGNASTSAPGNASTSAPGNASTSIPGNASTSAPGNASTSTPGNASTRAPGNASTSIPGNASTSVPGNTSASAPGNTSASAPGNASTSAPGNASTSAPRNASTSAPGNVPTSAPGNASTRAPGNASTSAPGNASTSVPRNASTSAPRNASTSAPGNVPTSAPGNASTSAPGNASTSAPPATTVVVNSSATTTTNNPVVTNVTNSSAKTTNNPAATNIINSSATTTNNPAATNVINSSATTTNNPAATNIIHSSATTTNNPAATNVINSSATTNNNPAATTKISSDATASSRSNTGTTDRLNTASKKADQITPFTTRPAHSSTEHKVPHSYPMPIETLEILIPFQVEYIKSNYSNSLTNKSSSTYQTIERDVKTELEAVFNATTGYQGIEIIGFWEGCIGVNFTASFKNVTPQILKEQLDKSVYSKINNAAFDVTFLNQTFKQAVISGLSEVCKGQLNKCPKDYNCITTDETTTCEHLCEHYNTCFNSGYCVVDTEYKPVCRCPEDENFVYGGKTCEVKAEKLALSKEYIIAIAAGVGGGIILILIIVIIVLFQRNGLTKRRQKDNVLDNTSELSEERAENPSFNPYLTRPNIQPQVANSLNIGQGVTAVGHRPADRQSERAKNARSEPREFQDRVPNYGDPVQLPQFERFQQAPLTSKYFDIDDGLSKSHVYQPTKTKRPLTESHQRDPLHTPKETKVYDYYNRADAYATGSSHPHETSLYDFNYENNSRQEHGINDPYSIKRPLVSPQRQF